MHVGVFDFGHAWADHGASAGAADHPHEGRAAHAFTPAIGAAAPALGTAPPAAVTAAAPQGFPAAGFENPAHSAQSAAASAGDVHADRSGNGSLTHAHRSRSDPPTGAVRSGGDVREPADHPRSSVLAQPDRSESNPLTGAARSDSDVRMLADHPRGPLVAQPDQPESDLFTGTFVAPLLSADRIGGHEQDCGDCGVHGGMHGCVFILSMLGLAIGLVLLFRLAFRPVDGSGILRGHRPARRERPPPWTMPTLAELSILRI